MPRSSSTMAAFMPEPMVHSHGLVRLRLDSVSSGLDVDLPDDRITVIEPMLRPAVPDPHDTLVRAIRSPIDRPPLRELWRPGKRVAISVCDITRAQPRRETIEALF